MNRADLTMHLAFRCLRPPRTFPSIRSALPEHAVYDKSAKRYVAAEGFSPLFLDTEPDAYLSRLRSVAEGIVGFLRILVSHSSCDRRRSHAKAGRRAPGVEGDFGRYTRSAVDRRGPLPVHEPIKARPHLEADEVPTPSVMTAFDGTRGPIVISTVKFKDFLLPRTLEVRGNQFPSTCARSRRRRLPTRRAPLRGAWPCSPRPPGCSAR